MVAQTLPSDEQLTEARNVGVKMALSRGLSVTEADEVGQSTSIALWSTWAQYDPDRGPVKTWIGTIAWRKVQDVLRVRYRDSQMLEEWGQDQEDSDETKADLTKVPNYFRLDGEDRKLAEDIIDGCTYEELATRQGVSVGTIQRRIALLKNKL